MAKDKKIVKITLMRSVIGRNKKQKATIRALGLKKRQQTVEHNLTPQIEGMLDKIAHLVDVEIKG
jgi:large subunit ribosomal protein L30